VDQSESYSACGLGKLGIFFPVVWMLRVIAYFILINLILYGKLDFKEFIKELFNH
jgi:hypothetical protein